MKIPLASRSILAVKPNGERLAVVLAIGHPYEVAPEEWAIPVAMSGLHGRLPDLRGIDAWQVLLLAYKFVAQLLEYFVDEGGKLYWPETEEPLELEALLLGINSKK